MRYCRFGIRIEVDRDYPYGANGKIKIILLVWISYNFIRSYI